MAIEPPARVGKFAAGAMPMLAPAEPAAAKRAAKRKPMRKAKPKPMPMPMPPGLINRQS